MPSARVAGSGPKRQVRIVLKVTKGIAQPQKEKPITAKDNLTTGASAAAMKEIKTEDVEESRTVEEAKADSPDIRRRVTRSATRAAEEMTTVTPALATPAVVTEEMGVLGISNVKAGTTVTGIEMGSKDNPIDTKSISALHPDFRAKTKKGSSNRYGLTLGYSPYPNRLVPSPEACEEVYGILADLHGEVTQPQKMPAPSLEVAGCGEVPSVLDALLRTLISGNTQMARANEAIKGLVKKFGVLGHGVGAGSINWDKVRLSPLNDLTGAINPAGCAQVKGQQIKAILDMVYEENRERAVVDTTAKTRAKNSGGNRALSLDHFHRMSKEEAMTGFLKYPGIGVKTAACVILFCLRIPCFAVDTHVHKFCQWLGWVPAKANELDSFNHGEFTVPDHLKYGLHQLFIRHGQQCFKCRKATKPGTPDWEEAADCPLEHLLTRNKDDVKVKNELPLENLEE